jgi:hypothetical protein
MTYGVGDIVVIQSNLSYSGTVVPLVGTSGTIISETLIGADQGGNNLYRYSVDLGTPVIVASGAPNQQTLTTVWMTQAEIDGTSQSTAVDINAINSSWQSSLTTIQNSASTINSLVGQVKAGGRYYDLLTSIYTSVTGMQGSMTGFNYSSLSPADQQVSGNTVQKASDLYSFDSQVFTELAQNIFGLAQIVEGSEGDLQTAAAQAALQSQLAAEDNIANFNAYYSTYVTNTPASNALVPQATTAPAVPTPDTSNITATMLITPILDLEQD